MADFNTVKVDSATKNLTYADDSPLGITEPSSTSVSNTQVQALAIINGFNLGDGIGIYSSSEYSGRTINGFKSLVPGLGISLTTDATSITINSSATVTDLLGVLQLNNLGGGAGVLKDKVASAIEFRSLQGSGIVAVQQLDDTIFISANAVTSVGLSGTADIQVSSNPVTAAGSLSVALADTAVVPGTYTCATLTVDQKGRITAAQSGTIQAPVMVKAGEGISVSSDSTVSMSRTGIAAGVYTAASIIVDVNGRLTAATSNTIPGTTSGNNIGSGTGQSYQGTANQILSFRSLAGVGAISVSQSADTITISSTNSGTVTSVGGTGSNGIAVTGGPIASSGTFTVALVNTAVQSGSYVAPSISVDSTGRITAATSNTLGEVNTASNLAGGMGLFSGKNGVDLQFRSIVAGAGIQLSSTASTLTVASTANIVSAPVSATAPGIAGQMAFDGQYVYRCTATNSWTRAALSYAAW